MKLKLDENGHVVLDSNGLPVYVYPDGTEKGFDAASTVNTIARLNAESKTHREAKETALSKLAAFEGIEDPDAARKALDTVSNLDAKKLMDAGQVEQVKASINQAWEAKLKGETERAAKLEAKLKQSVIGGSFSRSKFASEKLNIPADLVESRFGSMFALDDNGNVTAKGWDGNVVMSQQRPGNPADFDEALEIIVGGYQYKDSILKADQKGGSGAKPGQGGGAAGDKVMKRTEWNAKDPVEQAKFMRDGGKLVD